jgi:hypothetical protein
MRLLTLSILGVLLATGIAGADRDRDRNRRDDRRPVVRDNRSRPVVRDNRAPVVVRDNRNRRTYQPGRTVVRGGRSYVTRPRYTGNYRRDRVIVDRRPLYHNNGTFRFHNGRTVVYTRPVISTRYYNYRVRPQIIVENYPSQYGYIWVSGSWGWNGGEWIWTGGHYEPDPAYKVYYNDDSYDVDEFEDAEWNDGY